MDEQMKSQGYDANETEAAVDGAEYELMHDEKLPAVREDIEDDEEEGDKLMLVFGKPYTFEGTVYTELDLHCLENVKGKDLNAASKYLTKKGITSAFPEMEMVYAQALASRMTKKPIEFFLRMPGRESIKLKNIVTGFLFAGDGEE